MKKTLSIFSANLLIALTMLLVISLGSLVQSVNLSWGLVATEVCLIAVPTILFLRRSGVPLQEGLRLKPIQPLVGFLSFLLGIGLYFIGAVIDGIMAQVSRLQSVPLGNAQLPKTGSEMAVYCIALAVFAPVCEEILFRGAVQGAYENRKSARFAITITALLFAFYHFRLTGLPALLPVALALSYVVWRTRSIYAGMLIHYGNNGMAALVTILYFINRKGLPFNILWAVLPALLVIGLSLRFISRQRQPIPVQATEEISVPSPARPWLSVYWPLSIVGILYFGVAALTLINTLAPKPASASEIQYGLPSLSSTLRDHYAVMDERGDPVGTLDCTLRPSSFPLELDCTRSVQAFEYKSGNSYFKSDDQTMTFKITWDPQTMELLSYSKAETDAGRPGQSTRISNGQLSLIDAGGSQTLDLPEKVLTEFEWAWHLSLLKANSGQSYQVPFAYLSKWDQAQKKSSPQVSNEIMRVYDDEALSLIQGNLTVRKITIGRYTAWYNREDALAGIPRPTKFDDGMFVYIYTP